MKKSLLRLLVSALLAPVSLLAASFEGKIDLTLTTGRNQTRPMTYAIKDGKLRIEMPGQRGMGGVIIDPVKRESTVLMTEQKMYMVSTMPEPDATTAGKTGDTQLEKTGEKEKILGYEAEKYIATHDGTKTELWLAEGLGAFASFSNPGPMGRGAKTQTGQAWEKALAGKDLFPLRVVSKDKTGGETFRMEVTAINKESLDDSLFTPPADYRKFDMGGMMKGLFPGTGR